jgi:tetratricopeptide (TPR) repeat protein
MKSVPTEARCTVRARRALALLAACAAAACSDRARDAAAETALDPMRVVLVPLDGTTELDRRIAAAQRAVAEARDPAPQLERLGDLLVAKARIALDPGYYKLAEQCAAAIEQRRPGDPGALLLRGHVLHSLHWFAEAERIGRDLVARRGDFLDHGLLGDVLFDLGRVGEALDCYREMQSLRPCLQSYARAAQVRWLRGDLEGARMLLGMAVSAGSRRDPESLAWTHVRRATLELQAGALAAARAAADAALELLPDHPPALLASARIRLAQGDAAAAAAELERAANASPLPEYRWALADALRAAGRSAEADAVDAELARDGAREDPRTAAVYLASRGRDVARALELVAQELRARQDVFTHDAHAWALRAAGRPREARDAMQRALAEGTQDARLFYHAGAIAQENGALAEARDFFARAEQVRFTLLPSELEDLKRLALVSGAERGSRVPDAERRKKK